MTIANPLLLQNPIEKIDQIVPDYVVPAITQVIADNLAAIEALVVQPDLTWQNFMLPLDELDDRLGKVWSPVSHLNSVCNSDALRLAYDEALEHLTTYSTSLGQHQGLFNATKKLYDSREALRLSATQVHILHDSLIDFKLSGLHLPKQQQQEFAKIQNELAKLTSKFEQNVLDATMSWTQLIEDPKALAGLPENELSMLAAGAEERDLKGYLITLEAPSYIAIVTYADDRALREQVYSAFCTRASETGPDKGKFDNSQVMESLLRLRNAKAKLLGYNNYAELSLESKMAESPQKVVEFLEQLNDSGHQQAELELEQLKAFAKAQGLADLQSWDVAYYSEKLQQQSYQISQAEIRPYFAVDKVICGLFELTEKLFEVSFKQIESTPVWHKDVKHFQLIRNKQVLAEFYLDMYARSHKRGGAWMDHYQSRLKKANGEVQIPIAFLTCNFAPPGKNKPALLTHDEVVTLFHEFGHGIHHMLTQVDELSASGISNVPWDAVELPSQFMENFCYEAQVITQLSAHFETGQPLPQEKLEKLIAAKNFQSAMMLIRQLEFSLFDMRIHMSEPLSVQGVQKILQQTRDQVAVMIPPAFNRFQHGFSHIFAGGYSAGYYSYKWAEVLSADAFSLFEEEGVLNSATGKKFRENILEKGGSADPMELFVAFRGREPSVDALLRHSGIQ